MGSYNIGANDDGIHLSNESDWLTKPKFWPVGYILDSSYSPLALEEQFPEHKWRDAFEDLLAIESSGKPVGMSQWLSFDHQATSLQRMRDYKVQIDEDKATIRRLQGKKNSWWNGADARKRIERLESIVKTNLSFKEEWDDLYRQFRTYDSRKMEISAWMESMAERGILPSWERREEPALQDYLGGRWVAWKKLAEKFEDRGEIWFNTDVTKRLVMSGKPHLYVVDDSELELYESLLAKRNAEKKYPWEESQEDGEAHGDPQEHGDVDEGEEDDFEFSFDPSAYFDAIDGEQAEASVKSASQDYAKPSILSQLTRTERTTSPDGTVVTKFVLKKKFSDGTEENKETVSTSRVGEP
ncbi:MAG: hypothetical protein LQ342_007422 [Letrouitia transgressa]|nr:MAG: hypothetical protein LQ342_007422 [Letrouitia transgressa]